MGSGASIYRTRLTRLFAIEGLGIQRRQKDRFDWGDLGQLARSRGSWGRAKRYLAHPEL
ncbi:hypothetical protein M7I_3700 [Glarea lozoyensis 74030]|uniref:Uncharacterized protein n=1 Tax=Glarea lozoyensis (strain ATCC 74030 / MF5533) TaxID=1104152 RepID=H0EM71_GLAL7|nr:hypothetical protein M7I_3700 [Glarea lozoyensis 74030]